MASPEDLSPAGDAADLGENPLTTQDGAGADADTNEAVDQPVEEDIDDPQTSIQIGNGTVSGRYREILREQNEEGSEMSSVGASSVDAIPRRAGSPIDSVMSGPDDTPSIQVRVDSRPVSVSSLTSRRVQ